MMERKPGIHIEKYVVNLDGIPPQEFEVRLLKDTGMFFAKVGQQTVQMKDLSVLKATIRDYWCAQNELSWTRYIRVAVPESNATQNHDYTVSVFIEVLDLAQAKVGGAWFQREVPMSSDGSEPVCGKVRPLFGRRETMRLLPFTQATYDSLVQLREMVRALRLRLNKVLMDGAPDATVQALSEWTMSLALLGEDPARGLVDALALVEEDPAP